MVKRGHRHHWAGARLPAGPRETGAEEPLPEPAEAEPEKYCRTCGIPGGSEALLEFELLLLPSRIRAGTYRLCGSCYRRANPPPDADPLDVSSAA